MTGETGDEFGEMKTAAQQSGRDADEEIKHSQNKTPVSPNALTETLDNQLAENMKANRELRKKAFYVLGGLSVVFLLALLCVLWRFFNADGLAAIAGATNADDWHLLVLVGIGFAAFSGIPLSLLISLMRMISEKSNGKDEESVVLTSANAEVLKLFLALFKAK